MRPATTQISLGIRLVWSESSLCAQWVAKGPMFLQADSEDSDQTGRMPRLIWVFAGRTCHFIGFVMRRLKCSLQLLKLHIHSDIFLELVRMYGLSQNLKCKKISMSLMDFSCFYIDLKFTRPIITWNIPSLSVSWSSFVFFHRRYSTFMAINTVWRFVVCCES